MFCLKWYAAYSSSFPSHVKHEENVNQYNPSTVFVSENRTSDITQSDGIEARLRKKLFGSGYDPELRPVMNQSDKVTVTLGVSLHQIIEVVSRGKYSLLCNVILTRPTVFSRYAAMRMTKDASFYPLRFFNCFPGCVWTEGLKKYIYFCHF